MAKAKAKGDLEVLRERVKEALERAGKTQQDVESALDLPERSLSRVFTGRKKLDRALLERLAAEVGADALALVDGTGLASLLARAPAMPPAPVPAPEPIAVAEPGPTPEPARSEPPPEPLPAEPPRSESPWADAPRTDPPPRRRKRDLLLGPIKALLRVVTGG